MECSLNVDFFICLDAFLNITIVNQYQFEVRVITNLHHRTFFIPGGGLHQIIGELSTKQRVSIRVFNATSDVPLTLNGKREVSFLPSINQLIHLYYIAPTGES